MELEIIIQHFKIPAVCVWLPSRVTQVPFYQEFDFVAHPTVGSYFINKPFGTIWLAHVVEGLGIPLWKEPIVVGLVLPQQVDVEGRVYSLIFELLRQLNNIIICCRITLQAFLNVLWQNILKKIEERDTLLFTILFNKKDKYHTALFLSFLCHNMIWDHFLC